ncbi:ladinin-1 isoform X2 [Salminus brasiliensis]|uniref:ladinin-1 isoform X2 n=1 Tax=Salminus brasiliensis TaxID=930266 RepID=UPI003B839625
MSISRENWSALSTLAQQWTMEDKEEVERERRRKTKSFMSDVDTDNIFSDDTEPQNTGESSASEDSDSAGGGLEKLQLDFVEMLRVRDERRRKRHVETLSRQRQEEKGEGEVKGEEDCAGGARVEVLGDTENNNMKMNLQRSMEALVSSPPTSSVDLTYRPGSEKGEQKRENGGTTLTPTESSHTFDYQNESARSFEPTDKPAFTQQSSRTMSFRILKKKEEESMPLQRSASLRITAKKFESNQRSNNEEEQQSPFSRSSRQRLSSRTIQEKMERLAQASQKWEAVKSPAMAHKTLFLVDEVSRKRELFERDQKTANTSSAPNKQDYHTLSAGISSQVNRWIQKKTLQSLSSLTPTDLRHVDISSKKMLFEGGQADSHSVALK